MTDYVYKPIAEVTELAYEVVSGFGADDENATIVSEHLALADASGITTHGIVHLPGYAHDVEVGALPPAAKTRVLIDSDVFALVHGGWTFGQVGALDAIDLAVAKAQVAGVSMVGLVSTHHIGRLGHFVERAAAAGCTALIFGGGYGAKDPHVAPFGGQERVIGTNPIAFGFPGGETDALTYDFATTAVAGMKVAVARRRGESLPPGSIIGPGGIPTTDPEDFFRGGAHVPFGGHKGYAIALASEWLGHVLTDSDRYAEPGMGSAILGHQGVLFIVARTDIFAPAEQVAEVGDEMYRRISASKPAPGVERVVLPGQLEAETRKRSATDGVRLEESVWEQVSALTRKERHA